MNVCGGLVQIAYAVSDVRAAALRHSRTFATGPWFVAEHIALAEVSSYGAPAWLDHSSAYAWWGGVMAELVCIHSAGPDKFATAVMSEHGPHHVAQFVDNLGTAAEALEDAGMRQVMVATTQGGTTFAFHDGRAELGHLLEIYEADTLRPFYEKVERAAASWDGGAPLREIIDLT